MIKEVAGPGLSVVAGERDVKVMPVVGGHRDLSDDLRVHLAETDLGGGAAIRVPDVPGDEMAGNKKEHRVVIVGAGFAGFNAARELSRLIGKTAEIVVINSTDYFLYLPLMPQVTGGLIEPRHIRASLPRRLRKMRFVLGTVNRRSAECPHY
jgi:pyridine nucleotide-disulfide oxidoreductase